MNFERQQNPPQEIERKFLVNTDKLHGNPEDFESVHIRQGYLVLGEDGSEARLREKSGSFFMTVKSKGDLSRGEWEVALSEEQFSVLWPATEGKRIEKTRFLMPHGEYMIELDIFEGDLEGLVVAEVEFESEQDANKFEPPEWFEQDVTEDSQYKNQNLATKEVL